MIFSAFHIYDNREKHKVGMKCVMQYRAQVHENDQEGMKKKVHFKDHDADGRQMLKRILEIQFEDME
jgi:hypothetical protein